VSDIIKPFEATAIRFDGNTFWALDQRLLPADEKWLDITDPEDCAKAIQTLAVRGAPLIGVAAALSLALFSRNAHPGRVATRLGGARPTAVNLVWAVKQVVSAFELGGSQSALSKAFAIYEDDCACCDRISDFGAGVLPVGGVLTHCNAGALATAGIGTALGVIKKGFEVGKVSHVFVDETRPLLQGARLTAWELGKARIPYTVLCDHMAAPLLRSGRVSAVVVGADRIARNGDFANKIGTYGLALACRFHNVPLFVAAPRSTVDKNCPTGTEIPVEQRDPREVHPTAPAWNPAFDVTPASFVHRFVLDSGVVSPEQFRDRQQFWANNF
jgi:methylthioribose-1-phosphate isomerase